MPDIKLYTANTMNGWKPLIFLHEAEIDYVLIPIDFSKREQKEQSSLLKESRKLRGSGAQAGKAKLAGNVEHIAKRFNAVSVCARSSRRALPTGPVGFVAPLGNVTNIACGARLATSPVGNAEQTRLFQQAAGIWS